MKIYEILEAAKAKIINPENWMQRFYARTADGDEIAGNEEGAVCFCGFGAIEAVTGIADCDEGWPFAAARALSDAAGMHFPDFNDSHTHSEVLGVFDKAIQATKDAEQ